MKKLTSSPGESAIGPALPQTRVCLSKTLAGFFHGLRVLGRTA
jgi:hypothetical protein